MMAIATAMQGNARYEDLQDEVRELRQGMREITSVLLNSLRREHHE
jgi:hypothetical protein